MVNSLNIQAFFFFTYFIFFEKGSVIVQLDSRVKNKKTGKERSQVKKKVWKNSPIHGILRTMYLQAWKGIDKQIGTCERSKLLSKWYVRQFFFSIPLNLYWNTSYICLVPENIHPFSFRWSKTTFMPVSWSSNLNWTKKWLSRCSLLIGLPLYFLSSWFCVRFYHFWRDYSRGNIIIWLESAINQLDWIVRSQS